MKTIGMLIVKNESWILKYTIPQQLKFVDEIVVLDGNSTDDTVKILKSFGKRVHVRSQGNNPDNYSAWRQELLEWARTLGATHIICLDADECFSTDFLPTYKKILPQMKPGDKITMVWASLWKSPSHYLVKGNIFAHLIKDFIFCDDKTSQYMKIALHEGRTPGIITKNNNWVLPRELGVCLHYQFVPFERFQMKQAFQRCREYTLRTDTAKAINYKYEISMDSPKAISQKVPAKWIKGINTPESLSKLPHDWFFDSILEYFNKKGIEYYEPLQIWHIKKLKNYFTKKTKHEPVVQTYSPIMKIIRSIVGKILTFLPANTTTTLFITIKKITQRLGL